MDSQINFKLDENFHDSGETRDTLSRLVRQLDRK